MALLVALGHLLAEQPPVGSVLAGVATGLLVAPLFHLFQRGGIRPMTAGRGRNSWKLDALAGALVVGAIGAATWPPARVPDTSRPEAFVITFIVLPMLIGAVMGGARQIGLMNAGGPQDPCSVCGCSMRRYDRYCQACGGPLHSAFGGAVRAGGRPARVARLAEGPPQPAPWLSAPSGVSGPTGTTHRPGCCSTR